MVSSRAMPGKKKIPEQDYAVGDRVRVNLHTGRIVDATVKAIIERTDGKRLQVDFGKDETALDKSWLVSGGRNVHLWQVVKGIRPFRLENANITFVEARFSDLDRPAIYGTYTLRMQQYGDFDATRSELVQVLEASCPVSRTVGRRSPNRLG